MESGWPRWLLGVAVVPADPALRRAVATPQVPRPLSSWLPAGSAGRRIGTVVTIAVCLQRLLGGSGAAYVRSQRTGARRAEDRTDGGDDGRHERDRARRAGVYPRGGPMV